MNKLPIKTVAGIVAHSDDGLKQMPILEEEMERAMLYFKKNTWKTQTTPKTEAFRQFLSSYYPVKFLNSLK